MTGKVIHTDRAPAPGAYSQAICWKDLIFVAGQTSDDPETGAPVRDSITNQTERILKNIGAILEAAGSDLDHVLRADVYLSSMDHKPELDEVFRRVFAPALPARNTVAVAGLDAGLDVEIEVIAAVRDSEAAP